MRSASARARGTMVDPVAEQLPKASNGRPKLFLGAFDGGVMQRKLRGCVSEASPRGLKATGPIQRSGVTGLWWCEAEDAVTGEPRGKRWIQREGEGFRVLKADPREVAA